MYRITDENIDFILEDLRRRGIRTESLQLNLLDHICIIIEENLDEHGNFERLYAETIKSFYQKELFELENETNYLLYQNNFIMKKAMIISGALSAVGFIAGSFSKIMLFRITDFLLLVSFLSFMLLFLPLVLIVLLKDIKSKKDLIMYSSGTLSLMLYFACMLMKCLNWPSSNLTSGHEMSGNIWLMMWLACLAIASFIFIPSYLIKGLRKPETRINTIITSILLVAFIGVQFRLTNLKELRSAVNQHAYNKTILPPEKTAQSTSFAR